MLHNVIFLHINQNTKYISQKTGGQELVGWDAFLPGEKMSSSEMMVLWTYPFTLSLQSDVCPLKLHECTKPCLRTSGLRSLARQWRRLKCATRNWQNPITVKKERHPPFSPLKPFFLVEKLTAYKSQKLEKAKNIRIFPKLTFVSLQTEHDEAKHTHFPRF